MQTDEIARNEKINHRAVLLIIQRLLPLECCFQR